MFGKLIFIKKSGSDGSKYPVIESNVTIGRSEECMICIQNPQVSPIHCQLIVDDSGQVKLRNLSNHTSLNGKNLSEGDFALCHGDIFKVGDRMVRWEYHSTSKYYQQLLSPNGRLVAVVMPQLRSSDVGINANPSSSQTSLHKNSKLSVKRRFSERIISDNTPSDKVLKVSSAGKIYNSNNASRVLTLRHSFMSSKALFSPNAKLRRTSDLNRSQTPKGPPLRTLKESGSVPWNVKAVTPPESEKTIGRKSTPIKKALPLSILGKSKKSLGQSDLHKTSSLKTITELSPKNENLQRSQQNLYCTVGSSSPDRQLLVTTETPKRTSIKQNRLTKSEMKLKSLAMENSFKKKKPKKLSLSPKSSEKSPKLSSKDFKKLLVKSETIKKSTEPFTKGNNVKPHLEVAITVDAPSLLHSSQKPLSPKRKSLISPKKSPNKTSVISLHDKGSASVRTTPPTKPLAPKCATSPRLRVVKNMKKNRSLGSKTCLSQMNVQVPLKKKIISTQTPKKINASVSSAAEAAQRLKTRRPQKPDKNKKAALLVLGKATLKQRPLQNAKIKNKIIKKAIKQSSAVKDLKTTKLAPRKIIRPKLKIVKKKNKIKRNKAKHDKTLESLPISKISEKVSSSKQSQIFKETPKCKKVSETKALDPVINSLDKIFEDTSAMRNSELSINKIENQDGYLFNSYRRCSKRLSSKNDVSRPDFMELSPTALGLIPKNLEDVFKSPRIRNKRRSISLSTPKHFPSTGIIKSASTTKVGNRKSVRFLSKDLDSPETSKSATIPGTPFDFENVETPNISLNVFVSPLNESSKNSSSMSLSCRNVQLVEVKLEDNFLNTENVKEIKTPKSEGKRLRCARKLLQTPESTPEFLELKRKSNEGTYSSIRKKMKSTPQLLNIDEFTETSEKCKMLNRENKIESPRLLRNVKNNLPDVQMPEKSSRDSLKSKRLFDTLKENEGNKNKKARLEESCKVQDKSKIDIRNVDGLRQLVKTPRNRKSPRNDLTNVAGVKHLFASPRLRKSPKNDLSNITGVKQLFASPKVQRSPKNDLTNVTGVKQLFASPKVQKSPKNDLSDLKGVKQLFKSPKVQKSPKNDLSNLRGVKQLFTSPTIQKGPKNDISDVTGVKELFKSPKTRKSPRNHLTNVEGVKQLFKSTRVQKSPRNDLSNVKGVRQMFSSPELQKSPKNDLSDVKGVKRLLKSPRIQKSPKNDLSNINGIRQLYSTPTAKNSMNGLSNIDNLQELFKTPSLRKNQQTKMSTSSISQSKNKSLKTKVENEMSDKKSLLDVGVESELSFPSRKKLKSEFLCALKVKKEDILFDRSPPRTITRKSLRKASENAKNILLSNTSKNLKNKGKTPKISKKKLTDPKPMRFSSTENEPTNDSNISLSGVSQLFNTPVKSETPKLIRSTRSKAVGSEETTKLKFTKKTVNKKENLSEESTNRTRRVRIAAKEMNQDLEKEEKKKILKRKAVDDLPFGERETRSKRQKASERVSSKKFTDARKSKAKVSSSEKVISTSPSPRKLRSRITNSGKSTKDVSKKGKAKVEKEIKKKEPSSNKKLVTKGKEKEIVKIEPIVITKSLLFALRNMQERPRRLIGEVKSSRAVSKRKQVNAVKNQKKVSESSIKVSPRQTRSRVLKK